MWETGGVNINVILTRRLPLHLSAAAAVDVGRLAAETRILFTKTLLLLWETLTWKWDKQEMLEVTPFWAWTALHTASWGQKYICVLIRCWKRSPTKAVFTPDRVKLGGQLFEEITEPVPWMRFYISGLVKTHVFLELGCMEHKVKGVRKHRETDGHINCGFTEIPSVCMDAK